MGAEFTAEVVARVLQMEERLVIRQLAGTLNREHHLVREVGILREGRQRLSQFRFRHNLFQNYLYQDLTQSERAYLHEDMGLALEHLYAGQTELVAVQLAHHFQEAGAAVRAVVYLILAGERAVQLSAYEDAAQHFDQALTLLTEMLESVERRQQEFTVQFNLGNVWEAINGIGSQEAGAAYSRALALARQLGDSRKIIQALLALTQYAQFRSEFEVAQNYAEESVVLGQQLQDPELLMLANQGLQMIAFGLGQHDKVVTYSDQVIAFYRSRLSSLTFDDIYRLVYTLGISGLSLVPAGYPVRALQKAQEGLTLAQEHEHHYGTVSALGLLAAIHILSGEYQEGVRFGEAQRDFSETHNFTLNRTFGELHKGTALAMLGEVDVGIVLVRQAIAERKKIGVNIADAGYIATLGEACGRAGRVDEGLELVNEALAEIEVSNDRQQEPIFHRIKGDLLLLQDLVADEQMVAQREAEASFRRAIEVAQYQGAKLWEARALASLCRLLHSQGRDEGSRQQLAELYAWFTEGFETEDLQVARAVLQEP
jgi:tetratricopeptide (TPR) repeat protein